MYNTEILRYINEGRKHKQKPNMAVRGYYISDDAKRNSFPGLSA